MSIRSTTLGNTGPRGPRGYPGEPGEAGDDGQVIIIERSAGGGGTPGPPGPAGPSGQAGVMGLMGTEGVDGDPGPPGRRGLRGLRGSIGSPGQEGEPGVEGTLGPPGKRGQRGMVGRMGPPGRDGEDTYLWPLPVTYNSHAHKHLYSGVDPLQGPIILGASSIDSDLSSFVAGNADSFVSLLTEDQPGLVVAASGSDSSGAAIAGLKTRAAYPAFNANTIVASGDTLLRISGYGADGVIYRKAAEIRMIVGGTPGSGDMPGAMVFSVTPDGSVTPVDILQITESGNFQQTTKGSSSAPVQQVGKGTHSIASNYCHELSSIVTTQTTDATATNINVATMPATSGALIEVYVVAFDQVNDNKAYAAIRRALFRRTVLTTTLVGSVSSEYSETTDLACAVTINNSGATLRVQITGIAATTLNWTIVTRVTAAS